MYTLHIAEKNFSSWSLRPWLAMTETGIAFTEILHVYEEDKAAQKAHWRAFSPTSQVPVLVDKNAGGMVVWDSLAIIEYLYERHPALWPQDPAARAFGRCAAAEMHSGFAALRSECSMNIRADTPLQHASEALQQELQRLEQLWEEGLQRFGGPFLAGSAFCAADAFFAPVAVRAKTYHLAPYWSEKANAYVATLLALPSLQQWIQAA